MASFPPTIRPLLLNITTPPPTMDDTSIHHFLLVIQEHINRASVAQISLDTLMFWLEISNPNWTGYSNLKEPVFYSHRASATYTFMDGLGDQSAADYFTLLQSYLLDFTTHSSQANHLYSLLPQHHPLIPPLQSLWAQQSLQAFKSTLIFEEDGSFKYAPPSDKKAEENWGDLERILSNPKLTRKFKDCYNYTSIDEL